MRQHPFCVVHFEDPLQQLAIGANGKPNAFEIWSKKCDGPYDREELAVRTVVLSLLLGQLTSGIANWAQGTVGLILHKNGAKLKFPSAGV